MISYVRCFDYAQIKVKIIKFKVEFIAQSIKMWYATQIANCDE